MASHRRGPWTQAEDVYLCELVHTQGSLNWVRIAQIIGSRSPKQCRERYHQNLKPSLNHEPITPEEGQQIERMVAEMGKRWAEIARRLHGRSDNAVKNWWNGSMNRRRRLQRRKNTPLQNSHQNFEDDRNCESPPHTLISGNHRSNQAADRSMGSPTASEASHAESVDRPPSLVSDASSTFSFSPSSGNSPNLELPPLHYKSFDSKLPSLTGLARRTNPYSPEQEYQAYTYYTPRMTNAAQTNSIKNLSPVYQHQKLRCSPSTTLPPSPHGFKEPRSQIFQEPSVQLPPLRLDGPCVRSGQFAQRDARMHLSSLLGHN